MSEVIEIRYNREQQRVTLQKGTADFNILDGKAANALWETVNRAMQNKGWKNSKHQK